MVCWEGRGSLREKEGEEEEEGDAGDICGEGEKESGGEGRKGGQAAIH